MATITLPGFGSFRFSSRCGLRLVLNFAGAFSQNHVVGNNIADGLAGMHFWMGGKPKFVEGASVGEHDGIRSLEQPER